ncbi:hypothetical protein JCM10207_005213 [Rhodosporidiobolus poonsookiae]
MAAASPLHALPPHALAPSSPRQPLSSKIPRRRPSTQLAGPTPSAAAAASSSCANSPAQTTMTNRVVSAPSSPSSRAVEKAPLSPTKSALSHSHAGHGHARKSSRTHFATPLESVFPSPPLSSAFAGEGEDEPVPPSSVQDRRRLSQSHGPAQGAETREAMRRTPSLSIYIPTSSAAAAAATSDSPVAGPSTARSLRRASQPAAVRGSPHPHLHAHAQSPATPFTAHSRRSSAHPPRTPRSSSAAHSHPAPVRPPMAERHRSASGASVHSAAPSCYTSFDWQHPRTPKEELGEDGELGANQGAGGGRRWGLFGWGGGGRGGEREGDEEQQVGERTALLGRSSAGGDDEASGGGGGRWHYVAGETWCYAKHMLPPILIFVVVVLVVALLAYRQAVGRIVHPPHP